MAKRDDIESSIINVQAAYRFKYEATNADFGVWFANKGEGLSPHDHTYEHAVACTSGKIAVRKDNVYKEMTKHTAPIILRENEWHSVEALEDNTTFINIYPLDKTILETA
jgi:quercetin dioxygenase-like cupin family protein